MEHKKLVCRLARISDFSTDKSIPSDAVQLVHDDVTIFLPLAAVIDLDAEKNRLDKEMKKAVAEIDKLKRKLDNEQFLQKAPAEIIEEQRLRLVSENRVKNKLALALERLTAHQ